MAIITLTTDFGLKDGNVAIMKGVIWRIAPKVQIADISHLIEPHNIFEASLILYHAAENFPDGSIHVIVVDPGVGTDRRPIAAKIGSQFFVCPDNGILSAIMHYANEQHWPIESFHLTNPRYWLPIISHVFHGRDIFAPVAAHLANGEKIHDLGIPINDLIQCRIPVPESTSTGWQGQILYIDYFGNIVTNFLQKHISNSNKTIFRLNGIEINGMVQTFGNKNEGEIIALWGGPGNIVISMVNGNAAAKLRVKVGDAIEVTQ